MAKKALIVEDSDTDRAYLKRLVEELGFVALEAANGPDGIAKAKSEKPDVVFMDVMMEDMNGFEACRMIAQKSIDTKNIPVIICTSKDGSSDKVWGNVSGAKGYIVKPASRDNVKQALSAVGL